MAKQLNSEMVIPVVLTSSKFQPQFNMDSSYQRHGPFQQRLGSMASAFKTITRVLIPQKAGSDWVVNCSINGKKDLSPLLAKADAKRA